MTGSNVIYVGEDNETKIFGYSLNRFSKTKQFLICSCLVFIFYISYGYILELIFTLDGMQPHGWYLTLLQFGLYSAFAFIQLRTSGAGISRKIPLRTYFLIASLTVGTMGFSNSSMGYLNYPTQVIFKSCKLIPVMIGSVLILKKSYSFTQVLSCACMCGGLIWFTLADSSIQPSFQLKGVVLVCLALLCDAVIGNVQEAALKEHKESSAHVVLYSYFFGFFIIFASLVSSGALAPAVTFSAQHPWEVYGRGAALSLTGYCGVQVVLLLIAQFGAVVAVTVTTFRKALSIGLSFVFFSKPFTVQYLWGGLLVALGIYLNIYSKKPSCPTWSVFVAIQRLRLLCKNLYGSWKFTRSMPSAQNYIQV